MLFIRWVVNSLYLATPKSKRVVLMHSSHMLLILYVADSLFLATPKSKRVDLMHSRHMLLFFALRTLCILRRPRGSVWCLSFPFCAVSVVLEHALKHEFPTCGHFAIVLARAQGSFLFFSLCSCCVAVCVGFFADLAKQWRKKIGGVSEAGEIEFSIVLFVFCVLFQRNAIFAKSATGRVGVICQIMELMS